MFLFQEAATKLFSQSGITKKIEGELKNHLVQTIYVVEKYRANGTLTDKTAERLTKKASEGTPSALREVILELKNNYNIQAERLENALKWLERQQVEKQRVSKIDDVGAAFLGNQERGRQVIAATAKNVGNAEKAGRDEFFKKRDSDFFT